MIQYRRCLGAKDGSVYTIENGAGRVAKGVRSVVCRYRTISAEPEIVYQSRHRLQDALWLSPDDHVYTVCSSGRVHTNRTGCWQSTRVSRCALNALWGLSDEAILAGGEGGAEGLFRFDGARWDRARVADGLQFLERSATLLSFGATAPDDVYVVARDGFDVPQKCSLIHHNGSEWTPLEMRRRSGRRMRDIAKKGIAGRVNTVYCRDRETAYLCGDDGLLLVGNPRDGWQRIGQLPRRYKVYCLAELGGKLYFAVCRYNCPRDFGIMSWDGTKSELVRDDILPWYLTGRNGRLYVTWRAGFGVFDGKRWQIRGGPDLAAS